MLFYSNVIVGDQSRIDYNILLTIVLNEFRSLNTHVVLSGVHGPCRSGGAFLGPLAATLGHQSLRLRSANKQEDRENRAKRDRYLDSCQVHKSIFAKLLI